MIRLFRDLCLCLALSSAYIGVATAQVEPVAAPVKPPDFVGETEQNPNAPCLQPPDLVRIQDYNGPFQKMVGTFTRNLERKSVHEVHYKRGAAFCSLEPSDKFALFVHDTINPLSFLTVGFNAAISHAQDADPSFGQGMQGYGKRYGAEFADETTSRFFSSFVYPTLFSEDPRYYRLGQGSKKKRLFHALEHTFVAHSDNGKHMFNFSEWMGTSTAVAIGYTYHPNNPPTAGAAATNLAVLVFSDAGFDVLREFWPDIARKLHMPFRGVNEPPGSVNNPAH